MFNPVAGDKKIHPVSFSSTVNAGYKSLTEWKVWPTPENSPETVRHILGDNCSVTAVL